MPGRRLSQASEGRQIRAGGALDFLLELEERKKDMPGVRFILIAWDKFMTTVERLMTERSKQNPSFAAALHTALTEHAHLWGEARSKALEGAGGSNSPARGSKRARPSDSETEEKTAGGDNRTARNRRRRALKKSKIDNLRKNAVEKEKQEGEDKRKSERGNQARDGDTIEGRSSRLRCPPAEWKAFSKEPIPKEKRCKWWNLSCGCTSGSECRYPHACWVCGSRSHRWIARHVRP